MIFCEKKSKSSSVVQDKLDADLKKQQTGRMDEESCTSAVEKLAWVAKHTGFAEVGMTPGMNFDDHYQSPKS